MTFKDEKISELGSCVCCKIINEEFRLRNLTLKHNRAKSFVTSECGPRLLYPVWTTVCALYHLLNLLLMPYYDKLWPNHLAWPVYLTNLGYALLGVYSICDCLVTIFVHVKRSDILSGTTCESPWYIQFVWCLYNINNVVSLTVSLSYYSLLDAGFDPPSIITHMINSLFTIINIIICAKPTKLLHLYQPYLFSTVYILLTLIYHAAGGSAIYPILDWDNISVALPISLVVAFLLGAIVHLFVFALFKVRVFVRNRLCNEKKIDIIGIPINETDIEKSSVDTKY